MKANRFRFRAWDKRHDNMCYRTELHCYDDGSCGGVGEHSGRDCEDFILMQSTGLTDKNGKEIFEGDIVRLREHNAAVIVWNSEDGSWVMKGSNLWCIGIYCGKHGENVLEVIGNIYESPELIEATQ